MREKSEFSLLIRKNSTLLPLYKKIVTQFFFLISPLCIYMVYFDLENLIFHNTKFDIYCENLLLFHHFCIFTRLNSILLSFKVWNSGFLHRLRGLSTVKMSWIGQKVQSPLESKKKSIISTYHFEDLEIYKYAATLRLYNKFFYITFLLAIDTHICSFLVTMKSSVLLYPYTESNSKGDVKYWKYDQNDKVLVSFNNRLY